MTPYVLIFFGLILIAALLNRPPKGWISWYRDPRDDRVQYLVRYADGEGFYYSRARWQAEIFPTREEALAATPVDDARAGVQAV